MRGMLYELKREGLDSVFGSTVCACVCICVCLCVSVCVMVEAFIVQVCVLVTIRCQ